MVSWNQCYYFSPKNINCLSINNNLIKDTTGLVKWKPADNNKYLPILRLLMNATKTFQGIKLFVMSCDSTAYGNGDGCYPGISGLGFSYTDINCLLFDILNTYSDI